MMRARIHGLLLVVALLPRMVQAQPAPRKPAEPGVAAANRQVLEELPFADRQDFDDAMRGVVATTAPPTDRYAFLTADAPPTVNPSLWHTNINNVDRSVLLPGTIPTL